MTEVGDLEAKLGYHFADTRLLEQALTHSSVRHEQQTGEAADTLPAIPDNERLEFLGDAVIGMVIAELLYRRYPELHEGELTRLRAALVSRKHLGLVGTSLNLGSYLRLGKAEERNGGRSKAVLLANCMEALIGALYLSGGLAAAAAFVERTVADPYLEALRGELEQNRAIGDFKTALQELLQSRRAGQPEYVVRAESGPDHRKRFLVEVRMGRGREQEKAQAEGSTKKRAEQEAARLLYQSLRKRSISGERRDESQVSKTIANPTHNSTFEEGGYEYEEENGSCARLDSKRDSKFGPSFASKAVQTAPSHTSSRLATRRATGESLP